MNTLSTPQNVIQNLSLSFQDNGFGLLSVSDSVKINASEDDYRGPWDPSFSLSCIHVLSSTDLSRSGWLLIKKLLKPNPNHRLGPWTQDQVLDHPFFAGVDWGAVNAGLSPPPDVDFNRDLGFSDLLEEGEDLKDVESNLFEGF